MEIKKLIKGSFIFALNFSFFVLPFLLIVLRGYDMFECRFFSIDVCKFFIDIYGMNSIFLILILGIMISIFSFFSNIFEKKLKIYFSIGYSCLILIFILYTMNFGEFEFEINNSQFLFNNAYSKTFVLLSFKLPFYMMILGILIDVIRKIFLLF